MNTSNITFSLTKEMSDYTENSIIEPLKKELVSITETAKVKASGALIAVPGGLLYSIYSCAMGVLKTAIWPLSRNSDDIKLHFYSAARSLQIAAGGLLTLFHATLGISVGAKGFMGIDQYRCQCNRQPFYYSSETLYPLLQNPQPEPPSAS